MNQQYWNRLAKNFADRVFEIGGGETNGALAATVKKLSRRYKTAGDFGCGAGGTTPLLATYFDEVIAIDYAKKRRRIVDVGGTPTKHYMHDELVQQLADAGFAVATVARVEFPWSEVLDDLPQDLQKFRPWDWLAVASK